jgi:hypothetical protein
MKLADIRDLARERIRSGQLPADLPASVCVSQGEGKRCAVCEQAISSAERQYRCARAVCAEGVDFRLHFSCHQAWISCVSLSDTPRIEPTR